MHPLSFPSSTTTPVNSSQPPALHTALRELLRLYAPGATLLAALEGGVLCVRADGADQNPGGELVPPDAWLEGGELTWLTREGALLGLVWCADTPTPPGAAEVMTLLLAASRGDRAGHEADVLVTQFPVPAAWLNADLTFRQVSRPFLDLLGLSDARVIGRKLDELLPGMPALAAGLEQAAAGRTVSLPDEALPGRPVWLRGEARPCFGGAGAGVLWTLRDVSAEHRQAGLLEALLGGPETLAALLAPGGTVLHASAGLRALLTEGGHGRVGLPLWDWPCFADAPSAALRDLVLGAAQGGAARARVPLAAGGFLTLSARRTGPDGSAPLFVEAETGTPAGGRGGWAAGGLAARVLALGDHATVYVDHAGRAQLISDPAAALLGLDAGRLLGLPLTRVLGELGVRLHRPDGTPLPLPELRAGALTLPLEAEVLLVRADGGTRQLEVRALALEDDLPGARPGMLLTLRDVTALRHAQTRLRHGARHDALTGLLNRTGLREALTDAGPGTVLCLNLDGFGALNAALGRTVGDHLLIGLAARLGSLANARGGRAARLADDTFALFLPGEAVDAGILAADVRAALGDSLRAGRHAVPLSFALGLAPVTGTSDDSALADAELALHHARGRGRAATVPFGPQVREGVAGTFRLEDALRSALSGGDAAGLEVRFQPTVGLVGGQVVGVAALPHWTHPDLGTLSPERVRSLATRAGLGGSLAVWTVRRAAQMATWRDTSPDLRLSVRLGLEDLSRPADLDTFLLLLAEHGTLDVELSGEGLLAHTDEAALKLLDRLRHHGAHLWMADFGEGPTSLSTLTRLPMTGLRLHPGLSVRLTEDSRAAALVGATLDLARRLGWQVTASGVEREAQLAALRDLGCDAAQGQAVGPVLDAAGFEAWLRKDAAGGRGTRRGR
ncbi:EAL domain-containing protein [Deinococcus sp. YIM 134068]|uniref:EAL domain-containing protein n=1 Tax=Deinococcus lichenicola TaxID=3118910 RepID=UPI002F94CB2E